MKAKQNGEDFNIVIGKEKVETVPLKKQITDQANEGDVKLNDLTNSELLEILVPAMEGAIQSKADETRGAAEDENNARLTKIESNQNILYKGLTEQLAAAQTVRLSEKYTDFDDFNEQTLTVRKQNPNLSIEDCYLLAKAQAGSTIPTANEVGSERPNSSVRRTVPVGRASDRRTDYGHNANRTSSDQVFRDLVKAGTEKVLGRRRGIA